MSNPLRQIDHEDEFGDNEFEKLVTSEGPLGILQLILQEQADGFMNEEVTDADDYADWMRWVADAEQSRRAMSESTPDAVVTLMLQQLGLRDTSSIPTLLQAVQMKDGDSNCNTTELLKSSSHEEMGTRWREICQRIRIDSSLDEGGQQQLWKILERYQDVFAWNKGELGCCTVGEHFVDTQGFSPCRTSPGRLSYWEEAEVKRQIDVLVELGKMRPSSSEYACRVTLPAKKDGTRCFCGDYRPLNAQTRRDSFPMPLVENVIDQLGSLAWFTTLDLQSSFWQIRMAPEDVKKTVLITKTGLYDWTVMPFGLRNVTSTFTRTMSEVFKDLGSKFLKVFVDDLNVHNESWGEHLQHLDMVLSKFKAFQALRTALVKAPILMRPDFERSFCLDVDWSPKGVGAILSQREGKLEKVVAYASKSLTEAQKKFHPMEGECYALIWGIMHFRQYLYRNHFVLRTDHKPFEWLATMSDAHGRRGRWINMLQDFSFKIVH